MINSNIKSVRPAEGKFSNRVDLLIICFNDSLILSSDEHSSSNILDQVAQFHH